MSEKQPQVITYIGKIDNLNRGEHFKNVTLKLEDQKLVNIKLDLVDESKLVLGRIYQFIITTELKNETDTFLQCQSYQAMEDISDAIEIDRLYDIFYGKRRKAMVQMDEKYDRSVRAFRTSEFIEESEPLFFDGTVKKVFHAGIGCALIHRSILEKIPFRVEKGNNSHSDTFFAFDCFQHNIPIYVDTELQCKHLNFTWLNVIDELI